MGKKVNVSIVTYRTPVDELSRCLSCLRSSMIGRVYVVDNGNDASVKAVSAEYGCHYLPGTNIGYGAAHNRAMRLSLEERADYHLVLNSDVVFAPCVIDRIVGYMAGNSMIGVVQPRILSPDGALQYSVRMLPSPFDLFARRFLPSWVCRRRNDRYLLKHMDHTKAFNVPYHQGSFMMISREALLEAGLFDERYFMYPEDMDLTRRVHRHRLTMYYPGVDVVHAHRRASYHSVRMTWIHVVNMIRYFNKWGWWRDAERQRFNEAIKY